LDGWIMKRTSFAVLAFVPLALVLALVVDLADSDPDLSRNQAIWYVIGLIATLVTVVIYIRDVGRNERVPAAKRNEWSARILRAAPVAIPVYFWRFVR